MPENASITKVEACRDYGAEVIFHGNIWDESFEESLSLAKKKGLTYIHPFDDIDIIAGQGTLGLEIHEALKDVEIVAVPIGGGGLISGVTLAIKSLNPNAKIYGVQSEAVPSMKEALKAQRPVKIQAEKTIADGLAAKKTGDLTFKIVRDYVEDVVTVSDEDMSRAIFLLLQRCKILVEAAGSASVAAMINGKLDVEGKKTVAVLSGGNIDLSLLSQIIDREFVRSGRIMRLRGVLSDVPGELSEVLGAVSETRGNVLNIEHNRLDHRFSPGMAEVIITVDISSGSKKGLMNKLKERGYDFKEGATPT